MSCSRRLVAILLLAHASVIPRLTWADKAAADVAFAEAKRLVAAGKVAEACPKFEQSHREDPQLGTLLNVADCHEQLGRLATAWAEFREAMELARNRNDAREEFARERSEKLAPRVSHVVVVKRADAPGLHVTLDGRDVTTLVGVAIPVDPGSHVIATRSNAEAETTRTIDIRGEGRKHELSVPFETARTEVAIQPELSSPTGRGRRMIGLGVGATGVIVTAIGVYFGKRAYDRWDESRMFCDDDNHCDAQGGQLVDDARSAATTSNVLIGLGIGAIAAGAIVYLTAPKERASTSVSARAIVAPSIVGGQLVVQF